ncbi:hypothetical protein D3C75_1124130 [compost metagenome]
MVEGAFYRVFDPLGIESAAVIRGVPWRTEAALGESLRGQLAQCRDILFSCPFATRVSVLRHGDRQIDLTFDQPESLLLERVQPVGSGGRYFGLHALPGGKI